MEPGLKKSTADERSNAELDCKNEELTVWETHWQKIIRRENNRLIPGLDSSCEG